MKKFLKYLLLFILIFLLVFYISYALTKLKFGSNTSILSPIISGTSPPKASVFSIENPPTQTLKGKISQMTGTIDWQSRIATEPAKLLSPITIQQGEKLATGEKSSLMVTFSEASTVQFSENTEVEMIQTLPANIVFFQSEGTADYIKTGTYPVSIRAMSILLENEGETIVSINPKKPIVTITLKSGSAKAAFNSLDYITHEVVVSAGQSLSFNSDTRTAVLK